MSLGWKDPRELKTSPISIFTAVRQIPASIRDFFSRVSWSAFILRSFGLLVPERIKSFSPSIPGLPAVSGTNFGLLVSATSLAFPVTMTYPLFAVCRLVLGTLYPAYASYKAVRTKNVREYVSVHSKSNMQICYELEPTSKFAGEVDDVLDRLRILHRV